MGVITTTKAINLVGIGELPAGVKVSFKANFKERNQGLTVHSRWYKDQAAYDNGIEISSDTAIEGLGTKDNIEIELTESDWVTLAPALALIQQKVLDSLQTKMNDTDLLEII